MKRLLIAALVVLALVCTTVVVARMGELDSRVFLPAVMSVVCDCSGNVYNCADFDTQPHAQRCFDYCVSQGYGDVHYLDADEDGVACESLPAPTGTPTRMPSPPVTLTPIITITLTITGTLP